MERVSGGLSPKRALDALRGALAPQDALFLLMLLILLRHEADAERADEWGDRRGAVEAWDRIRQAPWGWGAYEFVAEIQRGLGHWEHQYFRLDGPPGLEDVGRRELAPLVDCVAAARDTAELFEACLELTQTKAKGGEYYTPQAIARLLIGLLEPRTGESVYDPVCGAGGFLLQAHQYVEATGDRTRQLGLYGQDASRVAVQVAAMNLTVHDAYARLEGPSSTLTDDRFRDETFDVVVANPPFNQSGWDEGGYAHYDHRWAYGMPPPGNANFAWAQHVASKLSPAGRGALLLPTGAATTAKPVERGIRAQMVEADLLSCVVELPAGLVPHVRNPVSLWLFSRSKRPHQTWGHADRSGQILLIDARETAATIGRGRRALPDEARERITATYAAWRGAPHDTQYEDELGWCRSVSVAEIAAKGHDVLPSHHVGAPAAEPVSADAEEEAARLTHELLELFATSGRLDDELRELLRGW
ncbi:SAM-dependent methyltransferase [Streptomyces sp. CA-210063]|uniref:SAM-dependent methyltransferase n=1 Tax=Streptomyces sp. CA-210063 TaxID=2801029 RepID=UPI00214C8F95|nr:SAM-dependent methyltransferase [Streptomyces sp. CA-210063]UUU34348.1 SAM-dependent methyltransferase [Streptomyces sp. CA-210063]